jgi:uncharacterized protein YndB with AHSA1/START domain
MTIDSYPPDNNEPKNYQPSPLAAAQRTFADGRWTLSFTRGLSHPVNRVWEAITEPGQLRHWAPYTANRDLALTGEAVLTMQDGADGSGHVDLPGSVLESDPPQLLVHSFGADVLRWELEGTDDGTTLTLRHTFADESMASALAAGWHLCLDVADALMKDVPFGPVVGARAREYGWDQLNERYAEVLEVKPSEVFEQD